MYYVSSLHSEVYVVLSGNLLSCREESKDRVLGTICKKLFDVTNQYKWSMLIFIIKCVSPL